MEMALQLPSLKKVEQPRHLNKCLLEFATRTFTFGVTYSNAPRTFNELKFRCSRSHEIIFKQKWYQRLSKIKENSCVHGVENFFPVTAF